MAKAVVFRCQFLSIFVERCPRCFQPVFDFFSFLLLKRDLLSEVFCAVIFLQDFDFDVVNRDLFCFYFVLVAEYLRFVRVDSQPTASVLVLNSQSISRSFF